MIIEGGHATTYRFEEEIDNGVEEDRKVVVCERLSYPDEKIVEGTLKEISQSEFTYMCVMVISAND